MRLGLGSVLFIVFLVLKLTGAVAWSWWWVTSPLWVPVLLIGILAVVYAALESKRRINKRK